MFPWILIWICDKRIMLWLCQRQFAGAAHHFAFFMSRLAEKASIILDDGQKARAAFPLVVSASRSTDIPAFYADWFFGRLKKGYSSWINPFNNKKCHVAYAQTEFIIFWSKNPRSLLKYLDCLQERQIGCYIQFTLNDYEADGLEAALPPLEERIDTFGELAKRLGKGSVIWRFDPLVLTEEIKIDVLLARIRKLGQQLHPHAEKLVFSFADILSYRKVRTNLERNGIPYKDWTLSEMKEFAFRLAELNQTEGWNLRLATCGELADLPGIEHNKCVDDELILRLCPHSARLREVLGDGIRCRGSLFDCAAGDGINPENGGRTVLPKNRKDPGQRAACGCIKSRDIGEYDTCPHLCSYCYANKSRESVMRNYERHKANRDKDTITGR